MITELKTDATQSNEDVINELKEILKHAENGDITSIAVAYGNALTNEYSFFVTGYYVPYTMAGNIEGMKLEVLGVQRD